MTPEHLDLEAMAKDIEADAGQPIDGLTDSLKEIQIGIGKVTPLSSCY
ncbi:hypothetical protein JX580_03120 [Thiomicrospira microaerophila]|nr:hypothetical protein [Thiomicrospira microaerophila]UQB42899.1 hypothetical protein JX580_03120 [Thiomicrospira microaerophila]